MSPAQNVVREHGLTALRATNEGEPRVIVEEHPVGGEPRAMEARLVGEPWVTGNERLTGEPLHSATGGTNTESPG